MGNTMPITLSANNQCLTVSDPKVKNGTQLLGSYCTNRPEQLFTYNPSTKQLKHSDLCVDLNQANTTNGNQIQLWQCNGTQSQAWNFGNNGNITTQLNPNKCITIGTMGGTADLAPTNTNATNQPAVIYDCTSNAPNQNFTRSVINQNISQTRGPRFIRNNISIPNGTLPIVQLSLLPPNSILMINSNGKNVLINAGTTLDKSSNVIKCLGNIQRFIIGPLTNVNLVYIDHTGSNKNFNFNNGTLEHDLIFDIETSFGQNFKNLVRDIESYTISANQNVSVQKVAPIPQFFVQSGTVMISKYPNSNLLNYTSPDIRNFQMPNTKTNVPTNMTYDYILGPYTAALLGNQYLYNSGNVPYLYHGLSGVTITNGTTNSTIAAPLASGYVTFTTNCDYTGTSATALVGDYTLQGQSNGNNPLPYANSGQNPIDVIGQNKISGLIIGPYTKVTLYKNINYGGDAKVFENNTPVEVRYNLCNGNFNDSTSSVKIEFAPTYIGYGFITKTPEYYVPTTYEQSCAQTNKTVPMYPINMAPVATPPLAPIFAPSISPTISPSFTPSIAPTFAPSFAPTFAPSFAPSLVPVPHPAISPSIAPSISPSLAPSFSPSIAPSLAPSFAPSIAPSLAPSFAPSISPSLAPSIAPSLAPSFVPLPHPSISPSFAPSIAPSISPSFVPSLAPATAPSTGPSLSPSLGPSLGPSLRPSLGPSLSPSLGPSLSPSSQPSCNAPISGNLVQSAYPLLDSSPPSVWERSPAILVHKKSDYAESIDIEDLQYFGTNCGKNGLAGFELVTGSDGNYYANYTCGTNNGNTSLSTVRTPFAKTNSLNNLTNLNIDCGSNAIIGVKAMVVGNNIWYEYICGNQNLENIKTYATKPISGYSSDLTPLLNQNVVCPNGQLTSFQLHSKYDRPGPRGNIYNYAYTYKCGTNPTSNVSANILATNSQTQNLGPKPNVLARNLIISNATSDPFDDSTRLNLSYSKIEGFSNMIPVPNQKLASISYNNSSTEHHITCAAGTKQNIILSADTIQLDGDGITVDLIQPSGKKDSFILHGTPIMVKNNGYTSVAVRNASSVEHFGRTCCSSWNFILTILVIVILVILLILFWKKIE